MILEFIINTTRNLALKEDLELNKLHNHFIISLEVDQKTDNYILKTAKKVVFCGIENDNELYTIKHLRHDQMFMINDILAYHKNREFIEKQILYKQLNRSK